MGEERTSQFGLLTVLVGAFAVLTLVAVVFISLSDSGDDDPAPPNPVAESPVPTIS